MTAIFVGVIFVAAGFWGVIHWFQDFVTVLKGIGPISLFLGGLVALIAGIASVQARRGDDNDKN